MGTQRCEDVLGKQLETYGLARATLGQIDKVIADLTPP